MSNTRKLPPAFECPYCGAPNIARTYAGTAGGARSDRPVSVCSSCGGVGIFTGEGLSVRRPTPDERDEIRTALDADPALRARLAGLMIAAWLAERYGKR
ncbi:MAG TPA: hypothetical protein VFF43_16340 [Caldimonas sp.]|nr:hypothetical protein [Caldimonas sp.]